MLAQQHDKQTFLWCKMMRGTTNNSEQAVSAPSKFNSRMIDQNSTTCAKIAEFQVLGNKLHKHMNHCHTLYYMILYVCLNTSYTYLESKSYVSLHRLNEPASTWPMRQSSMAKGLSSVQQSQRLAACKPRKLTCQARQESWTLRKGHSGVGKFEKTRGVLSYME